MHESTPMITTLGVLFVILVFATGAWWYNKKHVLKSPVFVVPPPPSSVPKLIPHTSAPDFAFKFRLINDENVSTKAGRRAPSSIAKPHFFEGFELISTKTWNIDTGAIVLSNGSSGPGSNIVNTFSSVFWNSATKTLELKTRASSSTPLNARAGHWGAQTLEPDAFDPVFFNSNSLTVPPVPITYVSEVFSPIPTPPLGFTHVGTTGVDLIQDTFYYIKLPDFNPAIHFFYMVVLID